jgi:hypothetical protein
MTPRESTLRLLRQLSASGEHMSNRDGLPDDSYESGWDAWYRAHAEAELAYDQWSDHPGREAYAVYRAAQDRADAAQDALARQAVEVA